MNFHSCQIAAVPREPSDRARLSLSLARQSPPSAVPFLSQTKRDSGRDGRIKRGRARTALIRQGQGPLSIRACVFSPERSLILIPFNFTHFIDSPGVPNEMLHLSVAMAVMERNREHGGRSIKSSAVSLFPLPSSLHGTHALINKTYRQKACTEEKKADLSMFVLFLVTKNK